MLHDEICLKLMYLLEVKLLFLDIRNIFLRFQEVMVKPGCFKVPLVIDCVTVLWCYEGSV